MANDLKDQAAALKARIAAGAKPTREQEEAARRFEAQQGIRPGGNAPPPSEEDDREEVQER